MVEHEILILDFALECLLASGGHWKHSEHSQL